MIKSAIHAVLTTTLKTLLILLSIIFVYTAFNAFYPNSTTLTTIISKHNWENYSLISNKKILANQVLKGEFIATDNRLGIVEVEFATFNKINYGQLRFRIKEKGDINWYHENIRKTHEFKNDTFFRFGFPIIDNSRNKTYQFEVESTNGTDEYALALSTRDSYFLSRYTFTLDYLRQNQQQIIPFIIRRTFSFFTSLITAVAPFNYLFVLFFSFLISIIQNLIQSKKSKPIIYSRHQMFLIFLNLTWLLTVSVTGLMIFAYHSEAIEWVIYQVSAVSIFIGAFILSLLVKKLSPATYKKFLNFHLVSFAAFILILSLTRNIMPRHLLFLTLSLLPFIQKKSFVSHPYPAQLLLINLISLISILAYFNLTYPALSFKALSFISSSTILIYYLLQFQFKAIKPRVAFPTPVLIIFLLPIIFYLTQKSIDYLHYSYYIGPILDVIKNKSLLGDTPSQYGYLSIHFFTLFFKKLHLSFANFNLINTLLFILYYLASSLIIIKLVKKKTLAISLSLVFITLQTIFSLSSNSMPPSVGPIRFGFGLLIILILSFSQKPLSFIFGTILSSLALFWSIETTMYTVPAWLFTSLIFNHHLIHKSLKAFIKASIPKLLFFLLTSIIVFALIIFKEYSLKQVFPRISDYFEFASAYKGGYGALLIPAFGNYYIIILSMILGITVLAGLLIYNHKTKLLPLLAFISIHNIAIFSYFISRSHENNIVNITGFAMLELIIVLKLIKQTSNLKSLSLKRSLGLPIILFFILYSFRVYNQTIKSYSYMQNSYRKNMIDWFNPESVTPALMTALKTYYLENQPVVLLTLNQDTGLLVESNLKNELPLNPAEMTNVLRENWRQKYINPSIETLKQGTVIIVDTDMTDSFLKPVFVDIQNRFQLFKVGDIREKNLTIYKI